MTPSLTLSVLLDTFAICQLEPHAQIPGWARGDFLSVARTPDELSIVCPQHNIPDDIRYERAWRCLRVEGPLDLELTGILVSLAAPLADAGIPIFALSTFDTDYVLVKADTLERTIHVLRQAGHRIIEIGD